MQLNTPYLQLQTIRRDYRERGIFTYPKPYVYVLVVNFLNAGVVASGEQNQGRLLIDGDSDFVWNRISWYAQDVPFNPPQSMSVTTEDSTWQNIRSAQFQIGIHDLTNDRIYSQSRDQVPVDMTDPTWFSGWKGVDAPGGVLEQLNGASILGVAGNDTGIGHFPQYFSEPVVLKASTLLEITMRNRASVAVTASSHLFALHGARLFKVN